VAKEQWNLFAEHWERLADNAEAIDNAEAMRPCSTNMPAPAGRAHREEPAGRPRARPGPLGDACLCPEGPQLRSGCYQYPQCQITALAALASSRVQVRRGVHQFTDY
jgi:hypothetical protein